MSTIHLHHRPLAPRSVFLRHFLRNASFALAFVAGSVGFGAIGYHSLEGLPWLDATLNAAMILTGMGPVDRLHEPAAKLFAIGYSLYSAVAFLTMVAVLFAPVVQRFLHRFHLDIADDRS
jgi:hypothetical protein